MVDKELLDILCCPETKQDLSLLPEQAIATINRRIREGKVRNRGGQTVRELIDGALLRADHVYLYPIREDIPIMLIDEAIPCDMFASDNIFS
ncbi:MAG: hypothetical protein JW699_03535 [Chitinispirillaceae bacterium]|nr:hypothetical protein [Chitinispirillaceae bacterium]